MLATVEVPERLGGAAFDAAAEGVAALCAGSDAAFTLAHRDWPEHALERVPEGVSLVNLHGREH